MSVTDSLPLSLGQRGLTLARLPGPGSFCFLADGSCKALAFRDESAMLGRMVISMVSEPTAVGAVITAIAGHVRSQRWINFPRQAA